MVDKVIVDPEAQSEDPKTEEPLLAGKYKDQEALEKGVLEALKASGKNLEDFYRELESDLGKPNPSSEEEAEDTEEDPSETDFTKYEEEFVTNGALSEASYKELEQRGFPKHLVDGYLDGQQARAYAATQAVYKITGGEESYQKMITWADKSLTEQDKMMFNQHVNSGVNEAKIAVKALYADYIASQGNPPKGLITSGIPSGTTLDVYESTAQMVEDMSNPKYKKDPAFRAKVEQKLARSKIL